MTDAIFIPFNAQMLKIRDIYDLGAGQGPLFQLIPHFKFNVAGIGQNLLSNAPYPEIFLKRTGSRRGDACGAVATGSMNAAFSGDIITAEPVVP
jgi:hypothetical protein